MRISKIVNESLTLINVSVESSNIHLQVGLDILTSAMPMTYSDTKPKFILKIEGDSSCTVQCAVCHAGLNLKSTDMWILEQAFWSKGVDDMWTFRCG